MLTHVVDALKPMIAVCHASSVTRSSRRVWRDCIRTRMAEIVPPAVRASCVPPGGEGSSDGLLRFLGAALLRVDQVLKGLVQYRQYMLLSVNPH